MIMDIHGAKRSRFLSLSCSRRCISCRRPMVGPLVTLARSYARRMEGETWVRQMEGVTAARLVRQAAMDAPAGPQGSKAQRTADQFVADGPDKPFFDLQVSTNGPDKGADVLAVGAFGLALRSHDGGNSWSSAMSDVPDPEELHL